ncbi:MAG: alpha/beta hydrolase [Bacteroidia bacterium]|nr:alpha/beta hydrolase [Bacteroidia bacterium]
MGVNIDDSQKRSIMQLNTCRIFAIPGLGVDGRIYNRLRQYFSDFELIEWLEPYPHEAIEAYAKRMAAPIEAYDDEFILMGTSFGGIIMQEIIPQLPAKCHGLILLSTLKKNDQRPWFFPLAERLPIYQLFKGKLRYKLLPYWAPFAGITDIEEQKLLQDMFMNASTNHRVWGADKIVSWEGQEINVPFIHIHGKDDRVFPVKLIENAVFIPGAGHFMLYQQAEAVALEISRWLEDSFRIERLRPNKA